MNWRIPDIFSDLSSDALVQIKHYHTELLKFNKRLNLVSPNSLHDADVLHFADSLFSSRIVYEKINKNKYLYDVGSGNGFPGLVFGLLYQDINVSLLDVDQRKCEFLKHMVSSLKLQNVGVINSKIEDVIDASMDQIITRGFAPLHRAEQLFSKPLAAGGRVFYLKSQGWESERLNKLSGWNYQVVSSYKLPYVDRSMLVLDASRVSSDQS